MCNDVSLQHDWSLIPERYRTKKVQRIEVKGQRGRGRPELRWADVLKKDLKDLELKPEEAMDRAALRWGTHYADPKDLEQTQRQS